MLYVNKKTGENYRHLAAGVDCTNSRNGTMVVIFCPDDDEHTIYIKEEVEFFEEYEII